jgi:hypothetical protein
VRGELLFGAVGFAGDFSSELLLDPDELLLESEELLELELLESEEESNRRNSGNQLEMAEGIFERLTRVSARSRRR